MHTADNAPWGTEQPNARIYYVAGAKTAALPLVMAIVTPNNLLVEAVSITSLLFLAMLGAVGAKTGGASMLKASIRVTFWGAFAIAVAAAIGAVFGTHI